VRAWVALGFLVATAAWAQTPNACQQKCLSRDCSQTCSDDRCMKRCNGQIQSCVETCQKNMPKDELTKHQTFKGNCPGPNGRMVPCDQYGAKTPDENAMNDHIAKAKDQQKKKKDFPHQMPTAENYKELYEKNEKANK